MRGCYEIFMLGNPDCHFTDEWHIATVYWMLQTKKSQVLKRHTKGKTWGVRTWVMIFPLTWSTENSDLEGTLPVRGVDHLHHTQCLLTNPIGRAPTTSSSSYVFIGCLRPRQSRTSNLRLSLKLLRSKTIVKPWLVYMKEQGTICLCPILSFKYLSIERVTLAMGKGSVYKGCEAACQGLILQSCHLAIWSIL